MSQSQPYSLEQTANVIVEYISDEIKKYYNDSIIETEILYHDLIDPWSFQNELDNTITLSKLVMYILDTTLKAQTEKEAYTQAKLLKKNRKDYFYRIIRQEIGELKITPNNPKYIETEWMRINDPYIRFSPDIKIEVGTKEEFFEKRISSIRTWFKNPESYLFQFEYFYAIPEKRRVNCFVQDLTVEILALICNEFYRNKFGFMTKAPDLNFGMENLPIVNWQSSTPKLQFQASNNKIEIFEELKYGNEQTVKIIIDEVMADCSTEEKKQQEILKLENEYSVGARLKTLDVKDLAIYSAVFNNMTIESATTEPLDMTLPDLAADLYGSKTQITKNMYLDLLNRLNKLAHMRITSSVFDDKGSFVSESVISFFDLTITINTDPDAEGKRKTINTIRVSENSSLRDFSKLGIHEFNNIEMNLMPSFYTKNMWKNNVHNQISTRLYKRINSQRGKMVSQLLQQERMRIYPELETTLNINFFKENIRVTSPNNDRIKKELISEMNDLMEMNIQIDNFHFQKNNVTIKFLPLTKEEKLFYKIES